jgi:hypothetical protein
MLVYRVIVGDEKLFDMFERQRAVDIARLYFKAFTLFEGTGYWKGLKEATLCFEIIGTLSDDVAVLSLARSLQEAFEQEEVLVTRRVEYVNTLRARCAAEKHKICGACGLPPHLDTQGDIDAFRDYGLCLKCYSEHVEGDDGGDVKSQEDRGY